jgi:hypothetical protein
MKRLVLIGLAAALAASSWGCQGRGDATAAPRAPRVAREPAASHVPIPPAGALPPATAAAPAPAAPRATAAAPAIAAAPTAETPITAAAPATATPPKRYLRYGCRSVDELMTKLLAALEAKDLQGMENLRVTRQEHTDLLWPDFDAKNHNVDPDFAWDMLNRRSHVGAGRAIGDYGGQQLTVLGVEFTRDLERYSSFVLHRGTILHARTQTGEMLDLMFLGSVVELDGQFKLLSFRD